MVPGRRVSIVIISRNRCQELLRTLGHLQKLDVDPEIIVVDNNSVDETAGTITNLFPDVKLVTLEDNIGAAGRNMGVEKANAEYIAFSDDDSWWANGALEKAADLFDRHAKLGLIAAKILIGKTETLDPVCRQMAHGLPKQDTMPGPDIMGFVACGTIVRKTAFLEAGGFPDRFGVGGEEQIVALDMASKGWNLCYVNQVVAHHYPSTLRSHSLRDQILFRNALWTCWLRRPMSRVVPTTTMALKDSMRDQNKRKGFINAAKELPWIFRQRRQIPLNVERAARALEQSA